MWVSKRVYKEKIGKILTFTKAAAMEAAEKDSKKIQETKSNENMNALQNFKSKTRKLIKSSEAKNRTMLSLWKKRTSATKLPIQGSTVPQLWKNRAHSCSCWNRTRQLQQTQKLICKGILNQTQRKKS